MNCRGTSQNRRGVEPDHKQEGGRSWLFIAHAESVSSVKGTADSAFRRRRMIIELKLKNLERIDEAISALDRAIEKTSVADAVQLIDVKYIVIAIKRQYEKGKYRD
jgi:hypothetical protein